MLDTEVLWDKLVTLVQSLGLCMDSVKENSLGPNAACTARYGLVIGGRLVHLQGSPSLICLAIKLHITDSAKPESSVLTAFSRG